MATTPLNPNWNLELVQDTAVGHLRANRVLPMGSFGVETDTGRFKIGDGATPWSLLEFAVTANVTSFMPLASAQAKNIITVSENDGGFFAYDRLNAMSADLFSTTKTTAENYNTYTAAFASETGRKHVLAIFFRLNKIAQALGSAYDLTSTAASFGATAISTRLSTVENSVTDASITTKLDNLLTNTFIRDTDTSNSRLWSSSKITSFVNAQAAAAAQTKINELVGAAPSSLDTIYELASALAANQGAVTTILNQLAGAVKTSPQTLSAEEQAQARANISALGNEEIGIDAYTEGYEQDIYFGFTLKNASGVPIDAADVVAVIPQLANKYI